MGLVSLGDMAQSFMLRRQNVALKSDLQRLSSELTTGRVVDTAARTLKQSITDLKRAVPQTNQNNLKETP